MEYFADRMANIKASDIRELLKIAARPDIRRCDYCPVRVLCSY